VFIPEIFISVPELLYTFAWRLLHINNDHSWKKKKRNKDVQV
jgi:hypothetical protein